MINNITTEEYFAQGHRACAGCGQALAVRYVLKGAGRNTVVSNATGCLEVFSTPFPQTSWRLPWAHAAFETAASLASGIDKGLIKLKKRKKINLLALAGDGGTFDIGFQALSGAAERGHKFTYVCFDNEAYMNTGIQRSGATPKYASTTTSPAGKKIHGKTEFRKDMPLIMAAHGCYVATASVAFPHDIIKKVKKSFEHEGVSYIQIFSPCVPGWGYASNLSIEMAKLAFKAKVTPLFEIEDGIMTLTNKPSKEIPVEDYLKTQSRFSHLQPKEIEEIQKNIDKNWEKLLHWDENKTRIV
ncbi:2-ketoisovalerate ferredoxin oxidoreductase [Candidatus Woesearchaeota archaeon CG10_big_fil_rev_8_21_14_0_10_44_13]|nr:MAG: 2-ketoisovalerate ferredoxin oxidoreductase [Candidatus Woesearchaeota archaeon CG10_big_fil_rev_8_21_14_0_10_44_13]